MKWDSTVSCLELIHYGSAKDGSRKKPIIYPPLGSPPRLDDEQTFIERQIGFIGTRSKPHGDIIAERKAAQEADIKEDMVRKRSHPFDGNKWAKIKIDEKKRNMYEETDFIKTEKDITEKDRSPMFISLTKEEIHEIKKLNNKTNFNMNNVLVIAEEKAKRIEREAEEKAVQLKREAEEKAAQLKREAEEKAAQLKREAEEKAAQLKREAEERAERIKNYYIPMRE